MASRKLSFLPWCLPWDLSLGPGRHTFFKVKVRVDSCAMECAGRVVTWRLRPKQGECVTAFSELQSRLTPQGLTGSARQNILQV